MVGWKAPARDSDEGIASLFLGGTQIFGSRSKCTKFSSTANHAILIPVTAVAPYFVKRGMLSQPSYTIQGVRVLLAASTIHTLESSPWLISMPDGSATERAVALRGIRTVDLGAELLQQHAAPEGWVLGGSSVCNQMCVHIYVYMYTPVYVNIDVFIHGHIHTRIHTSFLRA